MVVGCAGFVGIGGIVDHHCLNFLLINLSCLVFSILMCTTFDIYVLIKETNQPPVNFVVNTIYLCYLNQSIYLCNIYINIGNVLCNSIFFKQYNDILLKRFPLLHI